MKPKREYVTNEKCPTCQTTLIFKSYKKVIKAHKGSVYCEGCDKVLIFNQEVLDKRINELNWQILN